MDPRYQQPSAAPQPQAAPVQARPVATRPVQSFAVPATQLPAAAQKPSWKDRFFHPNNTSKVIAISVVGAALVVAASSGFQTLQNSRVTAAEAQVVAADKYQAVFLTNGQVYFGKISDVNATYLKLTDIYYLQQQADQAAAAKDAKQPAANPSSQAKLSLAKLGQELHAPEDAMYINKSQVTFWENLKNDGKVAQAIAQDKKK